MQSHRTTALALCRDAAAGYGAPLAVSEEFCVLVATGEGADITVSLTEGEAALWVAGHKWSEYERDEEDGTALETPAEDIAAIQRGDAEPYFKERGGELFPAGGRLGGRAQGPVPLDRLVLRLKPWLRLAS